jgi:hypothetical protein
MSASKSGEIFIERLQVGQILRITAMDVATATEVTFQVPLSARTSDIEQMAKSKLAYVLRKNRT